MTREERSIVLAAIRREIKSLKRERNKYMDECRPRSTEDTQHEIDVLKNWAERLKKEKVTGGV